MLPKISRILYATDLSETARFAMRYAMSLARQYEAEITVLHVVPDYARSFGASSGLEVADFYDPDAFRLFVTKTTQKAREEVTERIREECAAVTSSGVSCPVADDAVLVEVGDAAEKILALAPQFDLVVMGTRGHGRLGGLLVGSVAQEVLAGSDTPVFIVRQPKD